MGRGREGDKREETENGCGGLEKDLLTSSFAQKASEGKKERWFEFNSDEGNSFAAAVFSTEPEVDSAEHSGEK